MKTITLTTSQALVRFFDNQYINVDGRAIKFVDAVVGIFGHGNVLGIGEALADTDSYGLKFYRASNEQGAGHIAMGFAKQHKRQKTMLVTGSIGPGAMNMVTSAATATANRIPVLFVPGDVFACRQPDPVLQQLEHEHDYSISSNDAFRAVSKYWDRITRPEQLMTACINAMRVLTDAATTGAVTLALPQDVAAEPYDYPVEFLEKRVHYRQRRPLASGVAARMAAIIKDKKRPLLLLGGGVRYSEAAAITARFCETFNIPFAVTQAGKSTIACNHPLNLGGLGTTGTLCANKVAKDTDCLIAVGTRLNDFHTASKWAFQHPNLDIIGLNINPMDAYKMNAMPILCDVREGLSELFDALSLHRYQSDYGDELAGLWQAWQTEVERCHAERTDAPEQLMQTHVLGVMNNGGIADDAIVVAAAGSLPGDLERIWQTRVPDTYHVEYAYSCMGYEIAGAIGAKLAAPEREVYALVGDGSYLMLHQELVLAIQEGIKINVVLIDNGGWQCIDNLQTSQNIRRFACELRFRNEVTGHLDGDYVPIDFAMNARSYGLHTFLARDAAELSQSLRAMRQSARSTLVVIKSPAKSMTNGYETWWRAGTAQVSSNPKVEDASRDMQARLTKAKKF